MTTTEQDEKDVWSALGNSTDPTLAALRKKLSIHDFRTLFNLAWAYQYPPSPRSSVIEQCAKAAEAAADEWWKSLKAKDAGDKNAVDFGPLPDHMVNKIRALVHLPADTPST